MIERLRSPFNCDFGLALPNLPAPLGRAGGGGRVIKGNTASCSASPTGPSWLGFDEATRDFATALMDGRGEPRMADPQVSTATSDW
jgi:hypothetical protein